MTVPDQLTTILDELYGSDVATFTQERNRHATEARKGGEKDLAKQIGSLAKPSRSAYAVNLLVRSDDEVAGALTELGEELREAEQDRDAARMRELASRRRRLVDGLVRQAFELIGEDSPPTGQRDEVAATLNATLADPDVARHIFAGTLVRPVRWEGFGSVPLTRISALPDLPTRAPRKPAATPASRARSGDDRDDDAAAKRAAEARQAAEAAREAARQAELAEAESDAREADTELDAATDRLAATEEEIRDLEAGLTDAQRRLERARIELRRAKTRQREAHRVRDKLEVKS